jgi:pimeloyl-ACP methyl ester carboxylesterase
MNHCVKSLSRLAGGMGFAAREQLTGVIRRTSPGGPGVLVVPGFGCGDRMLTLTTTWLRSRGYHTAGARIGLNLGCTTELVRRLERRAEHHAERTGRRIVLLGHSRGGWLSRMLAVRRPDLVRALVTVGSPVLDPLGANPTVLGAARLLTRLSALGIPGLLDDDCFTGPCFQDNAAALTAPLPAAVPALAVYSRRDRVAPWQLCVDPHAECVEVSSGHSALLLDPDFYAALEPRLARWAAADPTRLLDRNRCRQRLSRRSVGM